MASSPHSQEAVQAGITGDANAACWAGIRDMDRRLLRGESFSGHERNCLFMNPGAAQGRWATASAVSGFDFDDDARAVAAVDWDDDGDLDLWVANRTAPRLRFLRNDMQHTGASLRLRLAGKKTSPQIIGARVTVRLKGHESQPLLREVRAGEGFLTQGSQRLHFGLGMAAEIASVEVRWPQGEVERIGGIAAAGSYIIEQGTGRAVAVPARKTAVAQWPAGHAQMPEQTFPSRVPLAFPVPLPPVPWTPWEGAKGASPGAAAKGRPALIFYWSTDENGYAARLKEIAKLKTKAQSLGWHLIGVTDTDTKQARKAWRDHAGGGTAGTLPATSMGRMERLGTACFEIALPLKSPTGWLLDEHGSVRVCYRATPAADDLDRDAAVLAAAGIALPAQHLPFPGTWYRPPKAYQPIEIATWMFDDQKDAAAAADYLTDNELDFSASTRFGPLCERIAQHWLDTAVSLKKENQQSKARATATRALMLPALSPGMKKALSSFP